MLRPQQAEGPFSPSELALQMDRVSQLILHLSEVSFDEKVYFELTSQLRAWRQRQIEGSERDRIDYDAILEGYMGAAGDVVIRPRRLTGTPLLLGEFIQDLLDSDEIRPQVTGSSASQGEGSAQVWDPFADLIRQSEDARRSMQFP